ncbi:hypothetical protein EPUS_00772 [Endocarpon pusillum Z07020]|uniref:Uncharacterized protein n=1 Tax=Endocarpon pusillum (strain Z07020 / HMAS-L-300199) TaxID=1263415 RepID=U1GAU6_ENDPU|nr:uncharacterized protein EPUS_00772 [Endocarpon pusillum Z07020]ERF74642.1 hypothetical protein EPUS_00772 [Endocarpon pusillum Z07020]
MAPFRMPFSNRRGPVTNGLEPNNDENARPATNGATVGKDSVALASKSARDQPNEYKMSSGKAISYRKEELLAQDTHVDDIFEPSKSDVGQRTLLDISTGMQDISGRSPVLRGDSFPSRTSLDSRAMRLPRSSVNGSTFEKPQSTEEEGFEDVGLQDESKPKKKSFLSRFGESASDTHSSTGDTGKSHFGLHLPGRKRGQSGQGAELGHIERPGSKGKIDGVVR